MNNTPSGPPSRKVTIEDREGIEALFNAADDAWRQRDLQALTTLYDFPIYVGTNDSRGAYQGAERDADQFRAAMTAMMKVDPQELSRRQRRPPVSMAASNWAAMALAT
jgi:hypothetical protein